MCAGVVLYHVLLELSERDRVSGRSGPEKWILGKILLLFAPGHTPKLILTASGASREAGTSDQSACSMPVGRRARAIATLRLTRGRLHYARLLALPNLCGDAGPRWSERPVP